MLKEMEGMLGGTRELPSPISDRPINRLNQTGELVWLMGLMKYLLLPYLRFTSDRVQLMYIF